MTIHNDARILGVFKDYTTSLHGRVKKLSPHTNLRQQQACYILFITLFHNSYGKRKQRASQGNKKAQEGCKVDST